MVKPVGVVLPLMLLVLDWYPLARFKRGALTRVFADKIPFLLFSCAISALTLYHAASNRILRPYGFLSIGERLVISGNAIFEYCRLLVLPLGINPLQLITLPLPGIWTVKSAIAGIACLLVYAGRKQRWLPAVWLCFLLPLLPVLAIFQNGDQALAARYTYLPSIAPCIATAILIATACVRLGENGAGPLRNTLVAAVFACLLFYAGMTFYLTKVWDNGETYWTRVVAMQPIAMPFFERGEFYDKSGRYAEAISDYTAALERASGDHRRYSYNIYAFRGEAYRSIGNYAEAVRDLTTAIRMSPHRIYYYCRGMALKELGQSVEAEEDFKIAGGEKGTIGFWYKDPDTEEIERLLRANSADAAALHQRGMAALRGREYGKSLEDFTKAISLQPSKPDYYWSRSTVYLENGKLDRALADCNEVLRLDAGNRDAYLRRASISAEKGDYGKALADIDSLLSLDPANYAGYANRGLLLYQQGKLSAAISDFDAAIRLSPEPAPIYYNRGLAHAAAGSAAKARSDLLRARDLGYQFDETEIKRILFTNQH
jgi:tetratricopeptide (TPR) repeat protein